MAPKPTSVTCPGAGAAIGERRDGEVPIEPERGEVVVDVAGVAAVDPHAIDQRAGPHDGAADRSRRAVGRGQDDARRDDHAGALGTAREREVDDRHVRRVLLAPDDRRRRREPAEDHEPEHARIVADLLSFEQT